MDDDYVIKKYLNLLCFNYLLRVKVNKYKLVHFCANIIISLVLQLRSEGRVANVTDVAQRGQSVKVKVLSYTGTKMSLSMKVGIYYQT